MSCASLNPFKQIATTTIKKEKTFYSDALVDYDILVGLEFYAIASAIRKVYQSKNLHYSKFLLTSR